jgi:hypothetical protein
VQLDNIATPQEEQTPEIRYASLHRAVERGMASDEVLQELVDICVRLGHTDEAVRVHATMKPGPARELASSRLVRKGLIAAAEHPHASDPHPGPTRFPERPPLKEHVVDAVQYLGQSYMPAVALVTMLSFPVITGLGGFLTAGDSPWLFAAIAALPGLCVIAVVAALARRIFMDAAHAQGEMAPMPRTAEVWELSKQHVLDHLLVYGTLVAPSLVAIGFGMPLVSSLPCLALSMFLLPATLILRMLRGDLRALSPVPVIRAIFTCRGYAGFAAAYWLAFLPAALALWAAFGHALWLQISVTGPLAVLPMFATARLLGTFADHHRERLAPLLANGVVVMGNAVAKAPTAFNATRTNHKIAGQRPAMARAVTHAAPTEVVVANKLPVRTASQPKPSPAVPPAARAQAPAQPMPPVAPVANVVRTPAKPAVRPQPAATAEPVAAQRQARQTAPALEPHKFEGPDLCGIPGARVITASERKRVGASARKQ